MRKMLAGLAVGLTLALAGTASANPPTADSCTDCNNGCNNSGFSWRPGYFFKKYTDYVKAPCPSSAPTRRVDAPLAFKSHPYVRSPRDYFMQD
jgi:hypothetical protein